MSESDFKLKLPMELGGNPFAGTPHKLVPQFRRYPFFSPSLRMLVAIDYVLAAPLLGVMPTVMPFLSGTEFFSVSDFTSTDKSFVEELIWRVEEVQNLAFLKFPK